MITSYSKVGVVVLLTVTVGGSGCSMLRQKPMQADVVPEPAVLVADSSRPSMPDPAKAVSAPDSASVAAIEEFLERTRSYARPKLVNAPARRPAGQSMAPGIRPAVVNPAAPAFPPAVTSVADSTRRVPGTIPSRTGAYPPTVARMGARTPSGTPASQPVRHGEPADPNRLAAQNAAFAAMNQRAAPTEPAMRGVPKVGQFPAAVPVVPAAPPAQFRTPAPALPVLQSLTIRASVTVRNSSPQGTGLSMSGVATPEASGAIAPAAGVSNVPVDVLIQPRKATWRTLIDDLEDESDAQRDVESTWRLGLARLAVDRGAPSKLPTGGLMTESRMLFDALFAVAASVRSLVTDPVETGEHALGMVDALRAQVADRSDPVVTNVELCSRVTTFGVFEPMGPLDVVAGRATQTIIYSEIENLHAKSGDDGSFRTRLSTRVEVLTADGQSVWEHQEPEIVDRCRRRRRDFFLAQRVTFPATLPAGSYVLKVLVEDLESGRTDEAIKPFVIASALSLAGRDGQ